MPISTCIQCLRNDLRGLVEIYFYHGALSTELKSSKQVEKKIILINIPKNPKNSL